MGQDKKYCYPNTDTLINFFQVKDSDKLQEIESHITSINIAELYTLKHIKGDFNFEHLKAIHKFIFKELYPFAGQVRTVDISKGELFCLSQHIDSFAKDIFKGIQKDNYLMGLDKCTFIEKVSELMGDLNALHPFREGNGRTQRAFIKLLGEVAGYNINFSKVNSEQMINASIKSFHGDNSGFEKMFNSVITSSRKEEQIQAISYLCDKESPVVKSFNYIKGISIKDKLYKAKEKSSVQKVKQIDKSKGLEK